MADALTPEAHPNLRARADNDVVNALKVEALEARARVDGALGTLAYLLKDARRTRQQVSVLLGARHRVAPPVIRVRPLVFARARERRFSRSTMRGSPSSDDDPEPAPLTAGGAA